MLDSRATGHWRAGQTLSTHTAREAQTARRSEFEVFEEGSGEPASERGGVRIKDTHRKTAQEKGDGQCEGGTEQQREGGKEEQRDSGRDGGMVSGGGGDRREVSRK